MSQAGTKLLVVLAGASFPVLLLWLWHLSAQRSWVSPLVLPPPTLVLQSFRETWADGTIKTNLAVSAVRVAKGFLTGAGIGLLLGTSLGLSQFFRSYIHPTFQALAQVNLLAWVPLLILVFGIDEPLKIAAITWSTLLPVTIITAQGIAGIPTRWFELAQTYELTRLQVATRVAFPAALPTLFTAIRSGLGAAWASLVVVELVASSEGIGFMVVWGRQLFQLDLVLVAIVVIGAVGLTLDLLLRGIELRLRRWQPVSK
jgi:sulfonate transport system permease protein